MDGLKTVNKREKNMRKKEGKKGKGAAKQPPSTQEQPFSAPFMGAKARVLRIERNQVSHKPLEHNPGKERKEKGRVKNIGRKRKNSHSLQPAPHRFLIYPYLLTYTLLYPSHGPNTFTLPPLLPKNAFHTKSPQSTKTKNGLSLLYQHCLSL